MKKRTYSIRSVRRTKQYRIERISRLGQCELKILWSNMNLLKEGLDDMLGCIEQELNSRAKMQVPNKVIAA
jgi:hypothetical protein